MRTVLIAHREARFAGQLASRLHAAGYRTILCPGPWPPARRCIRCDVGYCPLTEGADLLIYEPGLTGRDQLGRDYNLALDSARAHPDIPILLAWSEDEEPREVADLLAQAPTFQRAARDPDALVDQVWGLIGSPFPAGYSAHAEGIRA